MTQSQTTSPASPRTPDQPSSASGGLISLCSLRTGDGLYGIDTRRIREVLGSTMLQRVPRAPLFIGGVVTYRGDVLTTVSLRALLGLEPRAGAHCVLVLEGRQNDEQFGLMVDSMCGVVTVDSGALESNPSALDPRSRAIFLGAYRMDPGLIVELDPEQLRPSRLAESGLFTRRPENSRPEGAAPHLAVTQLAGTQTSASPMAATYKEQA